MQINQFCDAARLWLAAGRHENVAGRQMFVHDRGPAAAANSASESPTLLLLHGFPTSCYDWRGIVERLSGRVRAIAPDLLGFGFSDKPVAYSYSLFQQADTIEDLLAKLKVRAAHVVSHDLSTSLHSELLARQAEGRLSFELQSSTFLNGSMLQWLATITPFQELLAANATLPQAIEICRTTILAMYVPGLQKLMRRPEAITAVDAQVMDELLRYQDGHLRLPAIAGYMRERYLHADRWLGALETAPSRVQIVWADGDPIAHVEMGRELARRCPRAKYHELTGSGHFLLMEDPSAVAERIEEFVCL
ncbi:MAG: alpha/beta hydrolase [Planctomycetia bacterium]|nr:alpha/beta hydrolase [Planctomycetia bacterium]